MTLEFATYAGEHQLDRIMELVSRDLSEPYSIFTYRYFIHSWPHLCITVRRRPLASCRPRAGERGTARARAGLELMQTIVFVDSGSAQASVDGEIVGVIVGKAALVASGMQGYIAMLAVDRGHRKRGIGALSTSGTESHGSDGGLGGRSTRAMSVFYGGCRATADSEGDGGDARKL